jgi:undecaprenyl-diphosphatase
LLLGLPKQKLEEFSFALAVVLTPLAIAKEAHRLIKAHALSGQKSALHLFCRASSGWFSVSRRIARA